MSDVIDNILTDGYLKRDLNFQNLLYSDLYFMTNEHFLKSEEHTTVVIDLPSLQCA